MSQKGNNISTSEQEIQIAYSLKLALIGGLLTTLGDTISTYAASIAIEESIHDSVIQNEKDQQLEKRLNDLEAKLKELQNEKEKY